MHSYEIQSILDKLAPIEAIQAVTTQKSGSTILDDTANNVINDPIYINRYNTQEDLPDIEDLKGGIFFKSGIQKIENQGLLNVNSLALWKASSSKLGNPIENVLNDNPNSFWQSDGGQPHTIDIYFSRRTDIVLLALYFSLTKDESYTPRLFKLYVGHSPSDAVFYKSYQVENLNGWIGLTFEDNRRDKLMKCQFLRLVFPVNHENGKDTHLRGVRLYTPSSRAQMPNMGPNYTNERRLNPLGKYTIR